jgi:ParB family transcriptional regulator, chromosome partitioning protein
MRRRGGLGRGLEALIPSAPQVDGEQSPSGETSGEPGSGLRSGVLSKGPLAGSSFIEIPIDRVDPNPRQPRSTFDEESLQELATSIEAVGVLQPIVVRPQEDRFQIVMGERRLRAAKLAGLSAIPAIVRITEEDNLLRDALIENIHREDLNPLEEAAAYEQLLADFGVTHEELASKIGRSRSAITNSIRLLRMAPSVQRRIAAGTLSAGHARAVAKLTEHHHQERLADRIVAEGLTVRQAEELARHMAGLEDETDEQGTERRSRSRPVPQAPGVAELAERLSDRLDTRVRVQIGKRKGKVLIEFATLDDLQRICDAIGLHIDPAVVDSHAPEESAEEAEAVPHQVPGASASSQSVTTVAAASSTGGVGNLATPAIGLPIRPR